jgi:uncharacterized repeat protein (TIGR02543 family)
MALATLLSLAGAKPASALLRNWQGFGDGTSWSDPANWSGGMVPGPGDEVLIDNLDAQFDYTVVLPSGAVTVSVARLTIAPSPGRTLTLVLPATNTGNPGLRVGDGVAGTDDIVLRAGAVMRNSSGASFGNGVELLSSTNGTMRIENGARHVHQTVRSASGIAPFLSTATGTETGEFEYDIPGTATVNIAASGRTYGSLTLTRTSGAASYGALGSSPFIIRGQFKIGTGVTFSSNMTGAISLQGNVVNNGFTWVVPSAQSVAWAGGAVQTVTGSGGVRLQGPASIQDGTTLAIGASLLSVENTLSIAGTLRLDQGSQASGAGTYLYHPATGKLVFNQGSGSYLVGAGPFWPAANGPSQVELQGAGITMQAARAVTASLIVGGPVINADQLTLAGTVDLLSSGSFTNAPVYSGEARLIYEGARTVGSEWQAGSAVGTGVPKHVVVRAGAGVVQLPSTNRVVPGDLTIESGALRLDSVLKEVEMRGSFTTSVAQGIVQGALKLTGGARQRLTGPAGFRLDVLRLAKSGDAAELTTDLLVIPPGGGNALEFNGSADELWLAGHQLSLSGALGGTNTGGRLKGGSGSKLSVTTTSGSAGTVGFAAGSEVLQDLTLSSGGGLTLATGLLVEGTMTLTNGPLATGANLLTVGPAGTVARTSGRVIGRLRKHVVTGSPTVRFEVGSANGYAPVTLDFANVTTAGEITASSVQGDHPQVAASGLDPTRTVNRYWTLEPENVVFANTGAIFQFLTADRDPGTTPTIYAVRQYVGAQWSPTTTGFRTATSTQALGLTSFGSFAIGDERSHVLNLKINGGGTVARSPDQPGYSYGTTVMLTASPSLEYHFESWSGDASGSTNPLPLVMNGDKTVIANFALNATAMWKGAGDGTSWADPANWNGGVAPGENDEVVFDHTFVTSSYSVMLPSSSATITVKRLGISPSAGRTITLELPASNTADPGIRVGDGFEVSEDLVLGSGAVLRNASGASAGHGIELDSTGTVRINNGARYVHATTRPANGLARGLLAVPGTDRGVFEYDVPGASPFSVEAAGKNYGSLTLKRTQGAATYTMTGSAALRVRGNLALETGVTLVSSMTDSLRIGGNLSNHGTLLTIPALQPLVFDGAAPESLSGAGGVRILSAGTIRSGSSLAVRSTALTVDGSLTVDGTLQLDPGGQALGSGTYSYHPTTGRLVFNPAGSSYVVTGLAPWPAVQGPTQVVVQGAGISMEVSRLVSTSLFVASPIEYSDRLTLSGTVELAGGTLNSPPIYAGEARLVYDGAGIAGNEWLEGTAVGFGVPKHVVIRAGAGALQLPPTNRTVPGDLTIESGTLRLDPDVSEVEVRGDFTTQVAQSIEHGALSLAGGAQQHVTGPYGFTLEYLRTNKSVGAVELMSDLAVSAPSGGSAIEFNGTADQVWLSGHQLSLSGSIGGLSGNGRLKGGSGSRLSITTTGGAGSIGFVAGSEVLQDLSVSANSGVTFTTHLLVEGALTLTSGAVSMGANTLTVGPTGTVSRTGGRVAGRLRKHVPSGSPSVRFEVGSGAGYSPVTLDFTNVTTPGELTVQSIAGDHPSLNGSGLDPARTVNRYWVLQPETIAFAGANATFEFVAADRDTGTDPTTYAVRRYAGGTWSASTSGVRTATSTQALDLTALGEFAIGEIQSFAVFSGAERNDRYAVRVEFPSPAGGPIVVDEQSNPSLGNIDPEALAGRTIVVYRDGRVSLTPNAPALRHDNAGPEGLGGVGALAARPGFRNQQLTPAFTHVNTTFPPYLDGILNPAWEDYDGDGDLDLPLYRNNGNNVFTEIPGFRALLAAGNYHGSSWCDYDGDGDQDLVIEGYNFTASTNYRTLLLRNDGGTFVNIAASQGMNVKGRGETAVWGDFDGDGDPDLFTPYHDHLIPDLPDSSLFYRNNGNGSFTERSFAAHLSMSADEPPQKPEGADAVDWDGDGDLDIYVASHLFLNDGNAVFTDAGPQVGLPVNFDEGGCFVDFDDDGDFDLYTKNGDSAHLFRNDAGHLTDVTSTSGLATNSFLWGDSWADVDNDGDLDLLQYLRNAPARLMVNQGNGSFVADPGVGAMNLTGGMSSWGDYDDDGDLDLLDGSAQDFPYTLNANRLDQQHGFDGSYLRVLVLDAQGRKNQQRATVELRAVNGAAGRAQARAVGAGSTYLSQNEYRVHFGLGVRGSVTRSPDLAEYDLGSTVQLTAVPATGYYFAGWTGDTTGTTNPLTVFVNRPRDIRAVFEILTYTLDVAAIGGGTVVKSPDQPIYLHGSQVQLTANPSAGYHFVGWSGDLSGAANPATVVVDGHKSITATFAINQYALTVATVGSGSITKNPDLASYSHGTVVQVTAVPAANYHFVSWSGDASGTVNPLAVTMNGARSITATFAIDTHPLTVTVNGSGSVTKNPNQASYDHGTVVQLTAVPAANYHFVSWSGDATGSTNPISLTMDAARSVTATFAIDTHTLQVTTVGNGTVAKSPDLPAYNHGDAVTLTATPLAGQSFVGWSGAATGTTNPLTVTMDANKAITATFTYSLAITTQGSGSVTRAPDQQGYTPGASVQLTAVPAVGNQFVSWSGDLTGAQNPATLVMSANRSVTATFAISTFTLNVSTIGSGSVAKSPNQATYNYGTNVTLTATPANGYHFVGWSGDATGSANPVAVLIDANKNVTATFAINTYTLSVTTTGIGSVVVVPNQAFYDHGTSVTLTANEGPGYRFLNWSGDTSATANPLSLIMTANKSLVANFGLRPLKQWVGASGGGDGSSWSDSRNWNENATPSLADTVVLDHGTVAGSYTVNLPGGGVGVTVARVLIKPNGGAAITLTLPATNTANPGLRVGDGLAGTNDIVVASGGVLRNASGAATGNGIDLASASNGTVRIENGGRYVHATLRTATAIASRLSIVTGTELGEFEYDVPNRNNFAIAASGITYGGLTLTRTAGSAIYTASGAGALGVRGTLRFNAGITWSSTMTGALGLGGDLVNSGANLVMPASQAIQFDGGVVQHLSGSSSIALSGASTITAATTLAIASGSFDNNGTMTIDGGFQLDETGLVGGTGTFVYGSTGTLIFNNTSSLQIGNAAWWPTTSGPPNVNVLGSGGINMNVNRSVTGLFQASAVVQRGNRLTLSGTNRLNPGASWTHTPIYSGNATLLYAAAGAVGLEWTAGTSVGSGVPRHVSLQIPGTLTLPTTDRSVPGNLSMDSGTLAFQAGDLMVQGNLQLDGIVQLSGLLYLNGNGVQTVNSSGTASLPALHLDKTAGSVQLLADLTLTGGTGNELEFHGAGEVLELNGHTLSIAGTVAGSDATSSLKGSATSRLTITGTGALGTLRFTAGSQTLDRLSVNRTSSGSVTLGTSLTVSGALDLVNGSVVSGANVLTLGSGATLTRTAGFVSGGFRKTVPTGATTIAFEVGSGTAYAPVQVAFASVTTSGTLTASTTAGDHPSIAGSGLDPTRTVNRYWTLTNSGIAFNHYDAVFQFNASDIDAGVNAANLQTRKYDTPDWSVLSPGTRTPTSLQALGMTSFSDFQIGEIQTYTLNVTPVGNGSVTKDPDQTLYDSGSSVTLTATPSPGHSFVGWSGSASGTANPLVVVMNANKNITASFTWALDVTVSGSGSVSRSPNQPNYAPGTVVTLTATPATGWHFVAWSGSATGTANPLAVTMDANKAITATFAVNTYTLNLTAVGNGTAAKSPDQPTYDHGTSVTLTATPSPGNAFVAWSGSATGATNPLTITMDGNKNVTATFTWTLDVTATGNGTVTKSPDQPNYAPGTVVQLTANPAPGYHLVSWGGDASGTANPLSVTMNANKSITATFAINTYTLTTSVVGSGSVVKIPNQATYDHGTSVQLFASPAAGWHFVSWSGDTTGTESPLTVVMTRNRSITANFAVNTYTLDVTTSGSGTAVKSPDQATYNHGTTVTLTATPAVGWHFVSWSGDTSGTTNPLTVVMTRNRSITAIFAINTYTLNVTVAGSGTVAKNPDQPTYNHGTVVQLTATPAAGWHFVSWGGDTSGTTSPLTVVMTRNRSITANFSINTYPLNVTVTGSGNVTKNPNQAVYDYGTVVQLTAHPATGWHFVSWSGDASGTVSPVSVTMDAAKNVVANFAINTYALDVTVAGNGSVAKNPNQALYDHGTVVQLTATPAAGWHFVGWSNDTTSGANPLSLAMTRDRSLTATFAIDTYTLAAAVTGSGTVTKSPDQASYTYGTLVQLTATPATGWHFTGWSGDTTSSANPLTIVMTRNRSVTATFAINRYSISISTAGSGSVTKSPDQALYDHGTVVRLTAVPAAGWHFIGWDVDVSGAENPLDITVTSDLVIQAIFEINTYALNVTVTGSGSVAKNPDQASYNHGTIVQLTATPVTGWHFVGWSGDASGTASPLAVTMDATKNIQGTFAINTYTLDVTTSGSGTVGKNPDQATYNHGTTVQLTATPATGWHFVGWTGDASGAVNPLSVTMTVAKNIGATFAINTYTLNVTVTGSGALAKSPDQPTYNHGTVVQLTVTPAPGWHFVGWSCDASGTMNPLLVTMDAPKNICVTFAINTYALTLQTLGNGSVAKSPNQATYNHGTQVTLTATPLAGHSFLGWSGDASGSANPLVVTMDRARTITAQFTYALAVAVSGDGQVSKSPDQTAYAPGTAVTLTATPGTGSSFVAWGGDTTGSASPMVVTVRSNRSITATFATNQYTLATSSAGHGTVTRSPDQASYAHGAVVTVTAVPDAGYHLAGWSGDATGTANPLSVTMDGPKSVVATFAINSYALALSVSGSGTVARVPDQATYDHGTVVQLTATPSTGWHFVGWSGDATGGANPVSVTMNAAKTVTATFAIDTHPLDVTVAGSGTVTRNPNQPFYDYGTVVTLGAVPATGWHFVGWSGDLSGATSPATVTIDGPKSVTATFAIDTHSLAVAVIGSGSVTKSPNQALYDYGTTVTLTAIPAANWHWVGWEGDATGSANPVVVTMNAEKSVTARFALDTHALAVQVSGSGSVTKSPDLAAYDHGTSVSLTATPAIGWHFLAWSGDATGAANPIAVVMDAPRSVTATFQIDQYALDVTVSGNGSVVKNPDQPLYDYGTNVQLTAVPAAGWHFVAWSGGATGSSPTATVLMNAARSVTATFAIDTYSLTLTAVGNGSATKSPDQTAYDYGTSVTLSATPLPGQSFVGWSGDASGNANPLAVTMNGPRSITAIFTWSLGVATNGQGSVSKSPDQPAYAPGSVVSLTATPATGWHFVAWSGNASGATNPLPVTMNANKSITANFAINTYALNVSIAGSGTVAKIPNQPSYDHGTVVQLTATPATGWHFVGWSGDLSGGVNPASVTMTGARNVTATFAIDTHTLAVSAQGQGTVTRNPDRAAYDYGSLVQITATPAAGWHFVGWEGAASGAQNPLGVTVTTDLAIKADFVVDTHTLSVTSVGRGTVSKSPSQASYDYGTVVMLTATPDSGFTFIGWSGDTTANGSPLSIGMTRDRVLVANFLDVQVPKVRLISPNGGELLPVGNTVTIRWENSDNVAVASVDIRLSRNGTSGPFETVVLGTAPDGTHSWVVTGPATTHGMIVITARDSANNSWFDFSDADFAIGGGTLAAPGAPVTEFALSPLVPNPTRGAVTIEYSLPVEARVRLTVVDVQGRQVATLVDGVCPVGRHRAVWEGARQPSRNGVYFVHYRAAGKSFVRRLNVTR